MLDRELNKWLNVCAVTLKGMAPKDLTGEVVSIWATLVQRNGVPESDLAPVFTRVLERETFFPTPAEFLKHWRGHVEATRPASVLRDPVTIDVTPLGVHTMAERENADPSRILDDPKAPSLPVTEEQRKAALERMENLPVAKLAKARRTKAADLIASDKRIQSLPEPTSEEISKKREELRRQVS